jgi:hypothetical protein
MEEAMFKSWYWHNLAVPALAGAGGALIGAVMQFGFGIG